MLIRIFGSLLSTTVLLSSMCLLGGCNTVQGIGQDIQQGGAALKQEANEHRR